MCRARGAERIKRTASAIEWAVPWVTPGSETSFTVVAGGCGAFTTWLSHSLIRRPSSNTAGTGLCPEFPRPTHTRPEVLNAYPETARAQSVSFASLTFSTMCLAVQFPRRPTFLQEMA